jgi:hypothetical protein
MTHALQASRRRLPPVLSATACALTFSAAAPLHAQVPVTAVWNPLIPSGDWVAAVPGFWLMAPPCPVPIPNFYPSNDGQCSYAVAIPSGDVNLSLSATVNALLIGADGDLSIGGGGLTVLTQTLSAGELAVNAGLFASGNYTSSGQTLVSLGGRIDALAGIQNAGRMTIALGTMSAPVFSNLATGVVDVLPGVFTLGSPLVTNDGQIRLTGPGASFVAGLGAIEFTGGGMLAMQDAASTLTAAANLGNLGSHLLRGQGQVTAATLVNEGTLQADTSGATLQLNALSADNRGTFQALAGGTLGVDGDALDNTGVVRALPGSSVDVDARLFDNGGSVQAFGGRVFVRNAVIDNAGGRFDSFLRGVTTFENVQLSQGMVAAGRGSATLFTGSNVIRNVALSGLTMLRGVGTHDVRGDIANTGIVWLEDGATMAMAPGFDTGATIFTGTGAMLLGGPNALVETSANQFGSHLVVNETTHVIAGEGRLELIGLTNRGRIDANRAGRTLALDMKTARALNEGTLQASRQGTLLLEDAIFANTGVIRALAGSSVDLDAVRVEAGRVLGVDGGLVRVLTTGTFIDTTHGGQLLLMPGSVSQLYNQIGNPDAIVVLGDGRIDLFRTGGIGGTTFTGGGRLIFADPLSQLHTTTNQFGSHTLINDLAHTFEGRGLFDIVGLENRGLVDANRNGDLLRIALNGHTLVNTDTLRASGGGILRIEDGRVVNTGAVVEALAGSFVDLAMVNGDAGTWRGVSGGSLRAYATGQLLNPNLTGLFHVQSDAVWQLYGTIVNADEVRLSGNARLEMMRSAGIGGSTFAGPGRLVLDDPDTVLRTGVNQFGALTLINEAGHAFEGRGRLEIVDLDNRGLLHADRPGGTLHLLSDAMTLLNPGTLRASNGGVLRVEIGRSSVFNAGGTIEALEGSFVDLAGAPSVAGITLYNGVLRTDGSGAFRLSGRNDLEDLAIDGRLWLLPGSTTGLYRSLDNSGSITVQDGARVFMSLFGSRNGLTLTGPGNVTLDGPNAVFETGANQFGSFPLVNGAGHTIQGEGQLLPIVFTNQGTVDANRSGRMLAVGNGALVNQSVFRASEGGTLLLQRNVDNAGGMVVATSGGTVALQNATISGGVVRADGGTIAGNGTIGGTNLQAGGRVAPGLSVGTLTVQGNYVETADNLLDIEIGPAGNDRLVVTGSASLAGSLGVWFIDGFGPEAMTTDQFLVLDAISISGSFANVASGGQLLTSDGLFTFLVYYGAGSPFGASDVVLTGVGVAAVPEPGAVLLFAAGLALLLWRLQTVRGTHPSNR